MKLIIWRCQQCYPLTHVVRYNTLWVKPNTCILYSQTTLLERGGTKKSGRDLFVCLFGKRDKSQAPAGWSTCQTGWNVVTRQGSEGNHQGVQDNSDMR